MEKPGFEMMPSGGPVPQAKKLGFQALKYTIVDHLSYLNLWLRGDDESCQASVTSMLLDEALFLSSLLMPDIYERPRDLYVSRQLNRYFRSCVVRPRIPRPRRLSTMTPESCQKTSRKSERY